MLIGVVPDVQNRFKSLATFLATATDNISVDIKNFQQQQDRNTINQTAYFSSLFLAQKQEMKVNFSVLKKRQVFLIAKGKENGNNLGLLQSKMSILLSNTSNLTSSFLVLESTFQTFSLSVSLDLVFIKNNISQINLSVSSMEEKIDSFSSSLENFYAKISELDEKKLDNLKEFIAEDISKTISSAFKKRDLRLETVHFQLGEILPLIRELVVMAKEEPCTSTNNSNENKEFPKNILEEIKSLKGEILELKNEIKTCNEKQGEITPLEELKSLKGEIYELKKEMKKYNEKQGETTPSPSLSEEQERRAVLYLQKEMDKSMHQMDEKISKAISSLDIGMQDVHGKMHKIYAGLCFLLIFVIFLGAYVMGFCVYFSCTGRKKSDNSERSWCCCKKGGWEPETEMGQF